MAENELEPSATDSGKQDPYVVVARRYRPQDFGDLVGQQQVSTALANAINTHRVGHAYLFTGTRGVGKTSTARILAKCLNCVGGPTPEPCGVCDNCASIAAGEDVDVLEIDGASNRGIDEIRQLRANVNIRPSRARNKIYIIDEVHMLTPSAFNALLKTLEEPPEHVKFIFCTTDPEKIPITVISRCQRFDFSGIATASIIGRLRHIVDAEGALVDDAALALLARRAGGSMRDSQSLLEQLLSFGGETITLDDVHRLLGTAGSGRIWKLLSAILGGDAAQALVELDAAVTEGADPGQVVEQLAGCFRDIMARLVGCPDEMLLHTGSDELTQLRHAAGEVSLPSVLAAMQMLHEALLRMRQSTQSRMVAEAAVVRVCCLEQLESLATIVGQLRSGGINVGSGSTAKPREAQKKTAELSRVDQRHSPSSQPASVSPTASASAGEGRSPSASAASALATGTVAAPSAPMVEMRPANLDRIWKQVLERLDGMTQDHASRCSAIAISAPNRLAIRFPATYTSSKAFCERPQQRQIIESALAKVVDKVVRIDVELAATDATAIKSNQTKISQAQLRKQVTSHPLVQTVAKMFDATVVAVEPANRPTPAADE